MKMFTDMPESDPRKLGINMEDENFLVGGKQLHELRVVDLKKECDRNKLPKNGTKRELIERLKAVGILSTRIEIDSDYFFSKRKGCVPLLWNVSLRQSSWHNFNGLLS